MNGNVLYKLYNLCATQIQYTCTRMSTIFCTCIVLIDKIRYLKYKFTMWISM